MFEERIYKKMRTEKIYYANGVKMKLIKEADGTVRTEQLSVQPVAAVKVEMKLEPVPEPIQVEIKAEEPVEVQVEEQAVQAEAVSESDAGECAPSDEQRNPSSRRRFQGRGKGERQE
jgi:hypothetical protein